MYNISLSILSTLSFSQVSNNKEKKSNKLIQLKNKSCLSHFKSTVPFGSHLNHSSPPSDSSLHFGAHLLAPVHSACMRTSLGLVFHPLFNDDGLTFFGQLELFNSFVRFVYIDLNLLELNYLVVGV
jgi:hypothetical protein